MKEKLISIQDRIAEAKIQEENRKFILEANYGIKEKILENPNFSAEIWKDYSCLPITLPKVLLALPKKTKKNKYLEFLIGERDCEAIGDEEWFDGYKKCFIATFETVVACHCCEDFWTDVFIWNLEFETLEEQSKKTQRAIHRILVGDEPGFEKYPYRKPKAKPKTLEQIQEENRNLIFSKIAHQVMCRPITLSRTIFLLEGILEGKIELYQVLFAFEGLLKWEASLDYSLNSARIDWKIGEPHIFWYLGSQFLEEQPEETQRAIYRILTGDNND